MSFRMRIDRVVTPLTSGFSLVPTGADSDFDGTVGPASRHDRRNDTLRTSRTPPTITRAIVSIHCPGGRVDGGAGGGLAGGGLGIIGGGLRGAGMSTAIAAMAWEMLAASG
jgi:hypothetical protein